jgi:hypothetical protein
MRVFVVIIMGLLLIQSSCKPQKKTIRTGSTISVKEWGAKGDGRTDDSRAIQYALDALPSRGGKLTFEQGSYLIGKGLNINRKNHFTIEGKGARIIAKAGIPKTAENSLLTILNCEHFQIKGLELDGNRDRRPTVANQVPCHNLRILDVRHADFIGVISNNGMQDGFTLQDKRDNPAPVRHVRFIDCIAINNYRQGLSVINGSDIEILGGEYSGTNGVEPQAGIDIEANKNEPGNERVSIKNVTFRDNNSYGVMFAGGQTPSRFMYIDSCFFYGNVKGAVFTVLDHTEITRCVIEGDSRKHSASTGVKRGPSLIHTKFGTINRLVVRDNIFRNTTGNTFGLRLGGNVKYAEVVNNTFESIPGTALVVYAGHALIVGNTFKDGSRRDIQVLNGEGHKVLCNQFSGQERSLLYNEAKGVRMLGNTFNQQELKPGRLLEQPKPLLTELPLPKAMERATASEGASARTADISVRNEDVIYVQALGQTRVNLPKVNGTRAVLIHRNGGNAVIELHAGEVTFDSGENNYRIPSGKKIAVCYFDGNFWRVY